MIEDHVRKTHDQRYSEIALKMSKPFLVRCRTSVPPPPLLLLFCIVLEASARATRKKKQQGVVACAFNHSTQEAEAGKVL